MAAVLTPCVVCGHPRARLDRMTVYCQCPGDCDTCRDDACCRTDRAVVTVVKVVFSRTQGGGLPPMAEGGSGVLAGEVCTTASEAWCFP